VFSLSALEGAARLVHTAFPPTPQIAWPLLAARAGAEVWVKYIVYGAVSVSTSKRQAGGHQSRFCDGLERQN
jgi:hypothetical protein